MKILFVLTGPIESFYSIKPSTLPILAALIPKKHSIEVVEGEYKDIDYDQYYDLVGISTVTSSALSAYEIADEFRKRGKTIVLGGWHPSALPEEAKQHADAVVIGEAEETWPQLLKDIENGKLKSFYQPTRPVDPKLIPSQRNNIYPEGTKIGIQATRGCSHRCKFCTMANIKHRNVFRMRPIENIINEIALYPHKTTAFYDDSLTVNPEYTKQLFKAMKGLNKTFVANGNIGVLGKDDELLKLASEAGCFGWFIGFESISQESLNSAGKPNNVSEYLPAVKKIHDYGMVIMGGFVLGFDDDTLDVFNKTDDFVQKSELDFAYYNILTPFPGTSLYARYENEGRILTKDWSKYDLNQVVFQPKHMSPDELFINVQRIRKDYFKTSRCIKRIIKSIKFGFNSFIILARENIMLKLEK